MLNAQKKGSSGEREAAKWLAKWWGLPEIPARNLEQVRSGAHCKAVSGMTLGHDLLVNPFVIEVKRCETLAKQAWWNQVCKATSGKMCPVVMYRRNRQPWRFLVPSTLIGVDLGFMELEAEIFLRWSTKFVDFGG